MTSKKGFVDTMSKIIEDKNIAESDKNHVLSIMEKRLANALGAERDIELNVKGNKLSARLDTILRDTHDMGKDVFLVNGGKDAKKILARISKVNKTKAFGAIAAASVLGLSNQFINRKITEKTLAVAQKTLAVSKVAMWTTIASAVVAFLALLPQLPTLVSFFQSLFSPVQ